LTLAISGGYKEQKLDLGPKWSSKKNAMKAGSVRPFRESKWVMCSSPVVLFFKFLALLRHLLVFKPLPKCTAVNNITLTSALTSTALTSTALTATSLTSASTSAISTHNAIYSNRIQLATVLHNPFSATITKISAVSEKKIASCKFYVLGLQSVKV